MFTKDRVQQDGPGGSAILERTANRDPPEENGLRLEKQIEEMEVTAMVSPLASNQTLLTSSVSLVQYQNASK
jgi:hypothetical protein